MPIRPENRARYPADWQQIRQRILTRAGHSCERCGVGNHAVGHRDRDGNFIPLCGNGPCDAAGQGLDWPSLDPISYADAAQIAAVNDQDGEERLIVIVLTIAHLDHQPEHNQDDNLQALCQRCHNRHDRAHRQETRKNIPGQLPLFQEDKDVRPHDASE